MTRMLVLALLLAACGKQGQLTPVAPRPAPVKPATAARAPSPAEMLRLGPQAVPARVDDQTRNAPPPERGADPFNLPPPQ